MKKYLLFSWNGYEASGGAGDFVGSFDAIDKAKDAHDKTLCDVADIAVIDGDDLKVILEYGQWGSDQSSSWKEPQNG